jgi:DNA-binding NarL/FixJ family response regulator
MVVELVPDLIVLDAEIAGIGDYQAAELIKTVVPEVPIFVISSQNDVSVEKEALSHGADAVFEKNQDLSSLVKNARAVCGLE